MKKSPKKVESNKTSAPPKKAVKKKAVKKKAAKPKTAKESVQPAFRADGQVAGPDEVVDVNDPGDETQRRYRYQHAYGAILLIGASRGDLPYKSIWCEHHDDLLAQRNGTFDSFQVKTRVPEHGPWELTTDGFISAVKKFIQLEQQFPGKIERYNFVSNTRTSRSAAKKRISRSPDRLLQAVTSVNADIELEEPFLTALTTLAEACSVENCFLYDVLLKLDIIVGPSLDDFEASLSVDHLGRHTNCSAMTQAQINEIRDELIQKIHDASSNRISDPSKHWSCANDTPLTDPRLKAKNLPATVVNDVIMQRNPVPFRFSPISTITDQRLTGDNLSTLERKLLKGGLGQQLETMRRRTISTEQHLLEIASAKPGQISAVRNQLEVFVQGVCDDAYLRSSALGDFSGTRMLLKVQERLERTADKQPDLVCGESYDSLVGMAGLLTEACKVWWSEDRDLTKVAS